jgi:hypothetical protein
MMMAGGDYSSSRGSVDIAVVEYSNGEHSGVRAIRSTSMIIEPLDLVVGSVDVVS